MTRIHQEVVLPANPERVYQALTNAKEFSELTGDPAEMQPEVGARFSAFGGFIYGRQIELVPNRRIIQAWRAKNWDEGIYSITRFDLRAQEHATLLSFDHTGFPEEHEGHLSSGWETMYWAPLRRYLESKGAR